MPPKDKRFQDDLQALNAAIDTSVSMLHHLQGMVTTAHARASKRMVSTDQQLDAAETASLQGNRWDPPIELDPLALAADAAALVRAHTTKLALLATTAPYTPSALQTVIRQVQEGPAPSLAHAVQACDGLRYTYAVQRELADGVRTILQQWAAMLQKLPRDGVIPKQKTGSQFIDVGLLWRACDGLAALRAQGIAGRLATLVDQYADTLADTRDELKAWGEGDDEGYSDLVQDSEEDDDQAAIDALLDHGSHIPAGDPLQLRERLQKALHVLGLVILLYQGVAKRRLRATASESSFGGKNKLPTVIPSDAAVRLDAAMAALKTLPPQFDELTMAFYDAAAEDEDEEEGEEYDEDEDKTEDKTEADPEPNTNSKTRERESTETEPDKESKESATKSDNNSDHKQRPHNSVHHPAVATLDRQLTACRDGALRAATLWRNDGQDKFAAWLELFQEKME